jgi:hypothetical protein
MAQADMFGVCGRMTTQPGRRDEVVDLIREFVGRGRQFLPSASDCCSCRTSAPAMRNMRMILAPVR